MVLVKPCTKQRRLHLNATAGRCDGTRQPSQTINYSIVLALGRMRTHTNYKSEVCGATIRGEPKLGQNYWRLVKNVEDWKLSSGEGVFRMDCSDLRAVLFPSSHLCPRSSLFSRPAVRSHSQHHHPRPDGPKKVYVLRWIAGRHAGVPEFVPPYTIAL